MHSYLAWSILKVWRFKVVEIKSLVSQMTTPLADIDFIAKTFKNIFSHECIDIWHGILRTRIFKYVHMKSLGSCMAPPKET